LIVRIETAVIDNQVLITVEGDIDLYSSPELRNAVLKAVPASIEGVKVHLGDVSYMDSSGVATLVEGLRSANEHGKSFMLVAPSHAVTKVLELARLDSVFEVRMDQ
jgi:anti-sigma B factor antagonist